MYNTTTERSWEKLVNKPTTHNMCLLGNFAMKVHISCLSFVGSCCAAMPAERMCEGQRSLVLEHRGRFMVSTNLKVGGHMLSVLHALASLHTL